MKLGFPNDRCLACHLLKEQCSDDHTLYRFESSGLDNEAMICSAHIPLYAPGWTLTKLEPEPGSPFITVEVEP